MASRFIEMGVGPQVGQSEMASQLESRSGEPRKKEGAGYQDGVDACQWGARG